MPAFKSPTLRAGYDALKAGELDRAELLAREELHADPQNQDAQRLLASTVARKFEVERLSERMPKGEIGPIQSVIYIVVGSLLLIVGVWLGFEPAVKGVQEGFFTAVHLHYPWSGEEYRYQPFGILLRVSMPVILWGAIALGRGLIIRRILRSG